MVVTEVDRVPDHAGGQKLKRAVTITVHGGLCAAVLPTLRNTRLGLVAAASKVAEYTRRARTVRSQSRQEESVVSDVVSDTVGRWTSRDFVLVFWHTSRTEVLLQGTGDSPATHTRRGWLLFSAREHSAFAPNGVAMAPNLAWCRLASKLKWRSYPHTRGSAAIC
jgi:hypothetical protein